MGTTRACGLVLTQFAIFGRSARETIMKIVKRTELLTMPKGTVFAAYDGDLGFGSLCIKGITLNSTNDFTYQPLVDSKIIALSRKSRTPGSVLQKAREGDNFKLDLHKEMRESLMEEDAQLYVVWEKIDVHSLIWRLQESL